MSSAVSTPAGVAAAPLPPAAVRGLTVGDELERLAPSWSWSQLWQWPPDAFAFTSVLLADSGAYRFVVCPPPGQRWPPRADGAAGSTWEDAIRRDAAAWGEQTTADVSKPPLEVRRLGSILAAAEAAELAALEDDTHWEILVAALTLHALADEASAGAGLRSETPLQRLAADLLATTGSLAHFSCDRVRVLPKLRPPEAGITLRSLSHHLAIDRSEVETRWYRSPDRPVPRSAQNPRLTLLLVPYPETVHASDFQPVEGPLLNMDPIGYGFFDYAPQEPLELDDLANLVASAQRRVGAIDAVVLPEAALDEPLVQPLQNLLSEAGVGYLIAGARQPPGDGVPFGSNYAHLGGGEWCAPRQHKHHRWCLDTAQVHQYHLGASLDPNRRWWEAITLQRRSLTFVWLADWLTVCPLVCEDLARPDPVSDVIRAVAPTLVVGLLLDGPQLATRWPARYASVLADDPGSSVLTLTALGMTQRSQPPGFAPSRTIALWKDPHRGLQEIALADGARAVALTAHARTVQVPSADGRTGKPVTELVLSGIEQIE